MNIVTITTDMGIEDHYVAALKGAMYKVSRDLQIVDISHNIKPFNIAQASYYIKNSLKDFPDDTVHLIGVDSEPIVNFGDPDAGALPSFIRYKNQYIVATDNGIFSLILGTEQADGMWNIDDVLSNPKLMKFPTKNILAPAAVSLAKGEKPENLGTEKNSIRRALVANPVIEPNVLKGTVIHIDNYGNLITNITKADFERMGRNVPFTIFFRKKEYYIDEISAGYNEVPPGERLAIFNDNDNLEIAINKGTPGNGGGANSLFGLRIGDVIRVEFTPRGSKQTIESLF